MLQYRAAALAGFGTQCWWGFIKVMVFAAFFRSSIARQPMNLAQSVTYVWLGQAFLALLPWLADPEISQMVTQRQRRATSACVRSTPTSSGTCARRPG